MKSMIEALERRALFSGEFDATFGTNGVVTSDFDLYSENVRKVVTGPGGKIYAAGFLGGSYFVARYQPNGQLDTDFGGVGYVKTAITNYSPDGLAVSPSGKAYVAGRKYNQGATDTSYIAAFNADGTPDTTFDGDGVFNGTLPLTSVFVGLAYANDRLYAGTTNYGQLGVACFTPAGTLDPAFDGDGLASYVVGNVKPVGFVYVPSTFGNGPLVIAGRGSSNSGGLVTVKYNLNGTRDSAFAVSPSGTVDTYWLPTTLAADTGGRVYIGGRTNSGASVTRLTNAGQLDSTYGKNGTFAAAAAGGRASSLYSVTSLTVSGERVLLTANTVTVTTPPPDAAVSLTGTGQLNLAFGDGGVLALPAGYVADSTTNVTSNGTGIVIASRVSTGNDKVDTRLVRLNTPASPRAITGTLFDDVNGDGLNNDTGGRTEFFGITAYLDLNGNNVFDNATEPAAYAGNGRFVFDNLSPTTTYSVRLHVYAGIDAIQTYPAAGGYAVTPTAANNNAGPFGVQFNPGTPRTFTVSGTVFIDKNKNGTPDGTEVEDATLTGWYVYVDTNNSGGVDDSDLYVTSTSSSNKYTLTLPADGRAYRVFVRNENAEPFTTAAFYDVSSTVYGQALVGYDFGVAPIEVRGANADGVVFNDANKNGTQDSTEAGLADVVVYVDVDNDKVLDANEIRTPTDSRGVFVLTGLADTGSATRLRAIVPTGVQQTTPVDGKGFGLTLTPGSNNPFKYFGLYTPPVTPALGSLSGFCFDDADKDGTYDSNETKTSGKTVFLDLDDDGTLDTNEKKTTTAADGSWKFTGLTAGSYRVRRVFPSGYTQSTPPVDVTLAAGQNVSGLAIGAKGAGTPPVTNTASITGSVFNDNNKNGKYDSGDGYAKGVVVFLDKDNDGKLDTGETSVTTDSTGKFGFTKLTAGTYRVRRVMPTGYTYSTTKPDLTLTNGQAKSGVLIGTKKV